MILFFITRRRLNLHVHLCITTGSKFKLNIPTGDELPTREFDPGMDTFQAPPSDGSSVKIDVASDSNRLQLLAPFKAWNQKDLTDAVVLIKVHSYMCVFEYLSIQCTWRYAIQLLLLQI